MNRLSNLKIIKISNLKIIIWNNKNSYSVKIEMYVDKSKVKIRVFDGKVYLTDQTEYKSKSDAKAIVLFLKTKNLSVRARIIEKKGCFNIYFNQDTFYEIAYGTIKIPDINEVPNDIKNMVLETQDQDDTSKKGAIDSREIQKEEKNWRDLQQNRFKTKHEGNFTVIKLDKDVPSTDLLSTNITPKKENPTDEIELGINATLNHVENEFFKSCQKCGGDMKPTFMLVGQTTRLSIFQCSSCKFYIPRRM